MVQKQYLLDANIVITLWRLYPNLLDRIDETEEINYRVPKNIAGELSVKEYKNYKGVQILSEKFIKLLDHIVEIENITYESDEDIKALTKMGSNKNIYYIKEHKISANDLSLIALCKIHQEYVLVTEDKHILSSAKIILGENRAINFHQFIEELKEYKVL